MQLQLLASIWLQILIYTDLHVLETNKRTLFLSCTQLPVLLSNFTLKEEKKKKQGLLATHSLSHSFNCTLYYQLKFIGNLKNYE